MDEAFEAFVTARVAAPFQAAARAFAMLVRKVAPELEQGMRGGTDKYIPVPVWRLGRDVMVMSPSQKGLTISFARGAAMADPAGLLGGAGKTSRTTLLKTVEDVRRPELAELLRQVVPLTKG